MKAWLKGGLIGCLVGIVFWGFLILPGNLKYNSLEPEYIMTTSAILFGAFYNILSAFVIGLLIGLIIDKRGKMKAWLKGGLIGIIISILFLIFYNTIVYSIFGCYDCNPISAFLINSLEHFLLGHIDFLSLIFCGGVCYEFGYLTHLITSPISFFIIGALIGWVIGRIKRK